MYSYRLLFLSITILLLGCSTGSESETPTEDESNPQQDNPIYLDENGITIKCYDWG